MITLATRYEQVARRFTGLDKILPGKLQRRFDCLGSTTQQQHTAHSRRVRNHPVRELLQYAGREKRGMSIWQGADLLADRRDYRGVTVAEAGDGRPAAAVEVASAVCVHDIDAIALYGLRRGLQETPVNNVIHCRQRSRVLRYACSEILEFSDAFARYS